MIAEKSCGAVVFTIQSGKAFYIVIESNHGLYGFPKGHVEIGETETETALREIEEETGLVAELICDFRVQDRYCFMINNEKVMKQVVYFLAEFSGQTPIFQESELNGIYLMDYETAMTVLQFDSLKRILTEAHHFVARHFSVDL